ncbi:uncharacterized protein CLUP02_11656 [Colletotrichum lupini]|uniref:Uncharacterized protein n=1 Tax=Colletotrichum lupini TaxID=145971 RepID=A0A9Q8T0P5_9PEZI|nr:uncharacterized protein CLUP02_11656 [Colletotrichum lupini]UQC86156.1 hypothetical protein CLUP02_11656 [Colletotrichum lupini]
MPKPFSLDVSCNESSPSDARENEICTISNRLFLTPAPKISASPVLPHPPRRVRSFFWPWGRKEGLITNFCNIGLTYGTVLSS